MPSAASQTFDPTAEAVQGRRAVPILLMTRELNIGGCERDLAKLALAIDRNKFEPHVASFVSGGFRAEELEQGGVPLVDLAIRSLRSPSFLSSLRRLSRYIKDHGIQLLHAMDMPGNLVASILALTRSVPAVITSQLGARELYDRRTHRLLRLTDRVTDLVVANSEFQRQALSKQEGVPPERIAVCYNGVDRAVFYPATDAAERREALPFELRHASLIIGTVAALRPEKDIGTLLEAFSRVRTMREDARLLIVGSGPMLDEWKARAETLQIAPLVHFEPATAAVAGWMRGIDIYVLCSLSESFSNSLLEAMASGCCPVATSVGGIPEMITDEDTGLLVKAGDAGALAAALKRVLCDDGLRATLGNRAAMHAHKQLSVEAFARNMEEIYLRLLRAKQLLPTV